MKKALLTVLNFPRVASEIWKRLTNGPKMTIMCENKRREMSGKQKELPMINTRRKETEIAKNNQPTT